jgi:hypothetical protein
VSGLRTSNAPTARLVAALRKEIANTRANRWERASDEEFLAAAEEWEREMGPCAGDTGHIESGAKDARREPLAASQSHKLVSSEGPSDDAVRSLALVVAGAVPKHVIMMPDEVREVARKILDRRRPDAWGDVGAKTCMNCGVLHATNACPLKPCSGEAPSCGTCGGELACNGMAFHAGYLKRVEEERRSEAAPTHRCGLCGLEKNENAPPGSRLPACTIGAIHAWDDLRRTAEAPVEVNPTFRRFARNTLSDLDGTDYADDPCGYERDINALSAAFRIAYERGREDQRGRERGQPKTSEVAPTTVDDRNARAPAGDGPSSSPRAEAPKSPGLCVDCKKPLLPENAWMTNGCPCNVPAGPNACADRCLCLDVMSGQPGRDIDPRGCPVHDPELPASDGRDQRESVEVPRSLDRGGNERRPSQQGVTAGETARFKVGQRVRVAAGDWAGCVGKVWTLIPGGAWVVGISAETLFFRDSEMEDQWDEEVRINMQTPRTKRRGGHAHGCPVCYENVPCEDTCSIEPDLELDLTERGAYVTCDVCAAKAATPTPSAAEDCERCHGTGVVSHSDPEDDEECEHPPAPSSGEAAEPGGYEMELELDDLRHRLAYADEENRALRIVAYVASGIVLAGLLDGRTVKDDMIAALAETSEPGSLFTSDPQGKP